MKKIAKIMSASLMLTMSLSLLACGGNNSQTENPQAPSEKPTVAPTEKPSEKPTETPTVKPTEPNVDENSSIRWEGYYPISKMNKDNTLKVINCKNDDTVLKTITRNKNLTAACFQGLMNRTEVRYYVNSAMVKEGKNIDEFWINELKNEYKIKTIDLDFEGMIKDYKAEYKENAGYILYDDAEDAVMGTGNTRSVTAAVNMSTIRGWLPVSKKIEDDVKALGLEMKLDVSDKTEKWVFDNYKDEFNNNILVQQRPMESAGLPMISLRDFATANKLFTFFEEGTSGSATKFRTNVHRWAKPNMPILGWGPGDEGGHISFASKFGQFPVPSDFSNNLSVFNADKFHLTEIKQKNEFKPITPEAGKHYVAFGRSDGDNITVWSNEFPLSSTDFGSATKSEFPMGWSIQPSMLDLSPAQMNILYKKSAAHDYFIAPVSGHGYMYPSTYPTSERGQWFDKLESYLNRTDLSVVEILDHGKGKYLEQNIANEYGQVESLKGGICLNGYHYAGGQGAVIWSDNGKPFIAPRGTLWQAEKERVAANINSYQKDYTKIEGYSFINLHPWTHSYQDVEWVVDHLDSDVVVVSPEQLIDLISKNVEKKNKLTLDKPTDQVVIPVDPYENKFIETKEDWTGDCKFADGKLAINGTATKAYKLPNKDNLVIDMNYSGVGSIKIEMEISGVKKVLADNLEAYKGDGNSLITLPLNAYFKDYRNKDAKLFITAHGISIDNVSTGIKEVADPTSAGDIYNDKFDTSIEDYILYNRLAKGTNIFLKDGDLLLDGSDGWTGFFDRNVNSAIVKHVKLPNKDLINFTLKLEASDTGSEVRVEIIVDGKVYNLTNGFTYISKKQVLPISQILTDCNNKDIIVMIQQRDSNKNNGVGEIVVVKELNIEGASVDPHNNLFDSTLEDWYVNSGNIKAENGYVLFTGNGILEKKYQFINNTMLQSHLIKLGFISPSANSKFNFQILQDESVLYETGLISAKETNEIKFDGFNELKLEVKIRIIVECKEILKLDYFKASVKASYDANNNTFDKNMEDWKFIGSEGWGSNEVKRDANWPRLQFTYVNENGKTGYAAAEKTYKLPNERTTRITLNLEGNVGFASGRGLCNIELIIDGKAYTLSNEELGKGRYDKVIELDKVEALSTVKYEGMEVIIRITMTNNGQAGDGWLWSYKTETYK